MDVPEGNGNPLGNGLGRARQTRPIGQGDAPNRHQQRQGIVPPPVQNHNFEIKLGMINLVQNKMFHGLPSEDPIDHLDEFDRLCDLTKINDASEDAIKLRLFPMSLADKAHQWEKSLPHGTITTWDECKKAFLAKFFSTGRTAKLRNEISSFIQRNNETFGEAWERLKGYTSQCPHHGFSNESILSILYRGCLARQREMLDTAKQWELPHSGCGRWLELVENIALSTERYGDNYDSTDWSSTANSIECEAQMRKDLQALHSKIDKLIVAQFPPKQVSSISDTTQAIKQEGEEQQHTSTPPTTRKTIYGHTFYQAPAAYRLNPHRSNQQGHLRSFPPGFPPMPYPTTQSQDWDMKDMLQQLLQGQAKGSLDMNHKLLEINSKLESLTSRVQTIESSSASSSSSQEYAQAVTLRVGDSFQVELAHPKSLWTSMTRKGRIWSSIMTSRHRTRSSWNKTLNQNSIELEKPRLRRTKQSSIELRREQTKQAPANQLNLLQRRKTLQQDHHHTNPLCLSRKVQETTVGSTQGQV
ncbi:unnamed protein product [Microthlaspi erraticum]|uniref:Retrotransposon gag domain-containing protein n=1 Tax=Microthlaspi erraticum TaxID=1685480 RepID=A0A6D2I903_9BRAS|nr:unnamed protein product [Microthlaspi erraticum]